MSNVLLVSPYQTEYPSSTPATKFFIILNTNYNPSQFSLFQKYRQPLQQILVTRLFYLYLFNLFQLFNADSTLYLQLSTIQVITAEALVPDSAAKGEVFFSPKIWRYVTINAEALTAALSLGRHQCRYY